MNAVLKENLKYFMADKKEWLQVDQSCNYKTSDQAYTIAGREGQKKLIIWFSGPKFLNIGQKAGILFLFAHFQGGIYHFYIF